MVFHVDDLKCSHADKKVNTEFLNWLNKKYGEYGEVKATQGKVHKYLGMRLDYSENGKVKVNMAEYTNKLLDEFCEHYKLDGSAETPAGQDLFANKGGEILNDEMREVFHTFVAKCLFTVSYTHLTLPTIA